MVSTVYMYVPGRPPKIKTPALRNLIGLRRPPHRLCRRPGVFFRLNPFIVLSFAQEKIGRAFNNDILLVQYLKLCNSEIAYSGSVSM